MAFVVEDGNGLSNANSYLAVADADAYWADRGNAEWAALTTAQKEGALILATEFIDLRWGLQLDGKRAFDAQALEFPRVSLCEGTVTPPVPLPAALLKATAQYAFIATGGPLAPNPELDPTGRYPSLKREKVGPIEEENRWAQGNSTPQLFPSYPIADAYMTPLLRSGYMGGRVIR